MREFETRLNRKTKKLAGYNSKWEEIEVSTEFERLQSYEKYFICQYLINTDFYDKSNIMVIYEGNIARIQKLVKEGSRFADQLALLQTIKKFPFIDCGDIDYLIQTKIKLLETTQVDSDSIVEQISVLVKIVKETSKNQITIKQQNRSLSHKIKMFFNRFRVLDKTEAKKLNLVFLRNLNGDEIKRNHCRSIWLDTNMNRYRIKNYIS
jgi:hypothetical protein